MDLISRQAVNGIIDALFQNKNNTLVASPTVWYAFIQIQNLPSAQPEPLTDAEQRIFLEAMGREEKACAEVDRNYVREPYLEPWKENLMDVCREIRRKVKGALWT